MGTRGPQQKPAALKMLEGNPGQRPIPDDFVVPEGEAEKPWFLSGVASDLWDELTEAMPAGVYKRTDKVLLSAYCVAYAQMVMATQILAIESPVVLVPGQYGMKPTRNPWSAILSDAMDKIVRLGSPLGLSPTARENIKAPGEKKPASKFAGLTSVPGGKKAG